MLERDGGVSHAEYDDERAVQVHTSAISGVDAEPGLEVFCSLSIAARPAYDGRRSPANVLFIKLRPEQGSVRMPVSLNAQARTRVFARVLGPFLAIVPGIVATRPPDIGALAQSFLSNPALVWIIGSLMAFAGIFVIANHQFWRGASAIIISLFGWLIGLRGLLLLLAPQVYERVVVASISATEAVRIGFGLIVVAGLKLTYDGWIAPPPAER
jgi:hypothetical protein